MKLNNISNLQKPVVIHAGEGIDEITHDEIKTLINSNYIKRKIIAVHGVAMTTIQAAKFKALVWCPASNYFMFGQTANISQLKRLTPVLFGSDSTLTACWDIWQHIRVARKANELTDSELFDSLTTTAAEIWKMKDAGSIKEQMHADIVIAERKNNENWDAVFSITPSAILMVIKKGQIQLFDESLLQQLHNHPIDIINFYPVLVDGTVKYVRGNIHELIRSIRSFHPQAIIPVETVHAKYGIHAHTH